MTSSTVKPCFVNGAGFVGNGCVGYAASPGTSLAGTDRSSTGHSGFPVTRSNTNRNPSFVGAATASTRLPSCITVTRFGGGGEIVVPKPVVRDLKVPYMFAGARVEAQQRLGNTMRSTPLVHVATPRCTNPVPLLG